MFSRGKWAEWHWGESDSEEEFAEAPNARVQIVEWEWYAGQPGKGQQKALADLQNQLWRLLQGRTISDVSVDNRSICDDENETFDDAGRMLFDVELYFGERYELDLYGMTLHPASRPDGAPIRGYHNVAPMLSTKVGDGDDVCIIRAVGMDEYGGPMLIVGTSQCCLYVVKALGWRLIEYRKQRVHYREPEEYYGEAAYDHEDLTSEYEELENEIENLRDEFESLQDEYDDLEEEADELRDEIEDREQSLRDIIDTMF